MKTRLFSLLLIYGLGLNLFAQNLPANGGGGYNTFQEIGDEISPQQRLSIINMLKDNEHILRATGKVKNILRPETTGFEWPIRQANGFNDNGFCGISNYVDQNPNYPNNVLDYNCGNRTYDLSSGYNHAGTDIFIWPFMWQKMDQNAVEVIAAASGTIIGKSNGNFDQNCALCSSSCNWNAVYIMHADGSVAWYGHMKNNSLTSKAVGQTVVTGEYLGIVGSSGNSTGPHLHFEVYTNSSYTTLVDPWAGNCNNLNGLNSWWNNQQPYRVSTLNKIMTHSAPPSLGTCPGAEVVNEKVNFLSGDNVVFGTYYRDQLAGQSVVNTVYRPDNSIFATWTLNFTTVYAASYWYNTFYIPTNAPSGIWRFSAVYNGQTYSTNFAINTILPLKLINFSASKKESKVALNFATANEEKVKQVNILRSENGSNFLVIKNISAKNDIRNYYTFIDENPEKTNYYKLEILNNDGTKSYSDTKLVTFNTRGEYLLINGNPFRNELRFKILESLNNATVLIFNANGQVVYKRSQSFISGASQVVSTLNLQSGFYEIILQNQSGILDKMIVVKE